MPSKICNKILAGKRLTEADALTLFKSDDIFLLASLASHAAETKNGRKAYFVRNRHINPTNICVNRCRFCAFSRSKGQEGAYELTIEEIIKKLRITHHTSRITEVHIVGGLHPEWPFAHYLDMVSSIKKNFPKLHIKAFTAVEIDYFSKISGLSLEETLKALKRCGLGSMPGGGAEIFAPAIRNKLCPEKISGDRWLEVMAVAHEAGLRTNATMLYGHIESYEDRIDHMMKLRKLQDKTGGFQAFIPLAYHPKNTELGVRGLGSGICNKKNTNPQSPTPNPSGYTSGLDDLKTIAISRLYLDNFQHIKAYWVMLGEKISQLALKFGADDIDGTIIEEKITHSAGALTEEQLTAEYLSELIRKAGRIPVERDSFYRKVRRSE
ncbi:MAG: aminofutalosine synthase MqnE [Nitrospira bacterium HGW-Nitrospira-1]|nr:MAG: aminofutalosine synthase MqnE [Nitrospira bacterium HGW-Nitrospira-1]